MLAPLDGPRAKLARAREHAEHIQAEMDAWMRDRQTDGTLVDAVQYLNRHEQRWVLRIDAVLDMPSEFAVKIGKAVHDLRSALDHLVFALSFIDSNGTEPKRSQFPIEDSPGPNGYQSRRVQDIFLEGIGKRHRAQIEAFQPYRATEPHGMTPALKLLNDLSNDDKHRLLQPSLMIPAKIEPRFANIGRNCRLDTTRSLHQIGTIGVPLQPGTVIVAVPVTVTGPEPEMNVEVNFTLHIGFRNGANCQYSLKRMVQVVGEVLDRFAPAFTTKKARRLWREIEGRFPEVPVKPVASIMRSNPLAGSHDDPPRPPVVV